MVNTCGIRKEEEIKLKKCLYFLVLMLPVGIILVSNSATSDPTSCNRADETCLEILRKYEYRPNENTTRQCLTDSFSGDCVEWECTSEFDSGYIEPSTEDIVEDELREAGISRSSFFGCGQDLTLCNEIFSGSSLKCLTCRDSCRSGPGIAIGIILIVLSGCSCQIICVYSCCCGGFSNPGDRRFDKENNQFADYQGYDNDNNDNNDNNNDNNDNNDDDKRDFRSESSTSLPSYNAATGKQELEYSYAP